eukprot:8846304-Pyramimonas_sp.AAC.1
MQSSMYPHLGEGAACTDARAGSHKGGSLDGGTLRPGLPWQGVPSEVLSGVISACFEGVSGVLSACLEGVVEESSFKGLLKRAATLDLDIWSRRGGGTHPRRSARAAATNSNLSRSSPEARLESEFTGLKGGFTGLESEFTGLFTYALPAEGAAGAVKGSLREGVHFGAAGALCGVVPPAELIQHRVLNYEPSDQSARSNPRAIHRVLNYEPSDQSARSNPRAIHRVLNYEPSDQSARSTPLGYTSHESAVSHLANQAHQGIGC